MNNKGIVSDVQNHLYKKMNLLETENKQLRDYVHMLRKNVDESHTKCIFLQDEKKDLQKILKDQEAQIESLKQENENLIIENQALAINNSELNSKLSKFKEICNFVASNGKATQKKDDNSNYFNDNNNNNNKNDSEIHISKNCQTHSSPNLLRANSTFLPRAFETNSLQNELSKLYHKGEVDDSANKFDFSSPIKLNISQGDGEDEKPMKPKIENVDLYASKKNDDITYFETPETNHGYSTLKESISIPENMDSNIKTIELQPYNKINMKMENFFLKKTSSMTDQGLSSSSVANSKNLNTLMDSKNNTTSNNFRIFEEFLIVGVDKKEIEKKFLNEEFKSKSMEEATLLYSYPNTGDDLQKYCQHNIKIIFKIINQILKNKKKLSTKLLLPIWNRVKQNKIIKFYRILYPNNINDYNGNCFVFLLKPDEKLLKLKHNKTKHEFLKNANNEMQLYCICFIAKDFIKVSKPEFLATKKAYCFMTYLPFFDFFFEIIVSFLNKMKLKRMVHPKNNDNLSEIDSDFFYKHLRLEIEETLDKLRLIELPPYGKTLEFHISNEDSIKMKMPSEELCYRFEMKWGGLYALSNLTLKNFVFIYLSILLENSVTFFSSNTSLLSATLLNFHNLIKPFVWPHPFIFNLPKCFLQIFDSPVPFLAGVSKSMNFMNQNDLLQYEYVLYVDLDSRGEPYFQNMTNDVPEDTEKFLIDLLKEDWESLERSKSEVYKSRDEKIYLCMLEKLELFIKTNIIDKLPQNPIYLDRTKKILDFNYLKKELLEKSSHQNFIEGLMKTQLFIVYLEELYDC